jgi:hypothetical protein
MSNERRRIQKSEIRDQKSESGDRESEARGQGSEVRGQDSETGDQKSEFSDAELGQGEDELAGEYSDEELALADEFMELERAGKHPSVEEFLSRMPEAADRLRPVLEGAEQFGALVRKFKEQNPGKGLLYLLCQRPGLKKR